MGTRVSIKCTQISEPSNSTGTRSPQLNTVVGAVSNNNTIIPTLLYSPTTQKKTIATVISNATTHPWLKKCLKQGTKSRRPWPLQCRRRWPLQCRRRWHLQCFLGLTGMPCGHRIDRNDTRTTLCSREDSIPYHTTPSGISSNPGTQLSGSRVPSGITSGWSQGAKWMLRRLRESYCVSKTREVNAVFEQLPHILYTLHID